MKYLYIVALSVLFSCKSDKKSNVVDLPEIPQVQKDSIVEPNNIEIKQEKQLAIELKQETFIAKEDDKEELKDLILEKTIKTKAKEYILDFTYPLLNDKLKRSHAAFNEYINDYYVNVAGTINEILDDRAIVCDTIKGFCLREKRHISYKIYNLNDQLLSVLFYKENFYSGSLYPSYSFDAMNFDLQRGVFMTFEDFFVEGSENDFIQLLNKQIRHKVTDGDMYYDCWEISEDDFLKYKNNFVINDDTVEYYFDDCIVCPSYTGSYSVKLPLKIVSPFVKKINTSPLM